MRKHYKGQFLNGKIKDSKKNIVLMFPGQGSQYLNMGADFFQKHSRFLKYPEKASGLLGKDILKIIRDTDSMGSLLDDTRFSQIAIFCISSAINDYLMGDCMLDRTKVTAVIGHSLGDYSALYSSGLLSFDDCAKLVIFRGDLMGRYSKSPNKMMMAAVLGTGVEMINDVLRRHKNTVFIANYNDYTQTVISGYEDSVIKAADEIKAAGAKRVIPLKVNIASHCPLMKDIAAGLNSYIGKNFNDFSNADEPDPRFFSSTKVKFIEKIEVKKTLTDQLISPVKWVSSIESLLALGVRIFIEIGPGKVLSGLVTRIATASGYKDIMVYNTDSIPEMENLIIFLESNNLVAT